MDARICSTGLVEQSHVREEVSFEMRLTKGSLSLQLLSIDRLIEEGRQGKAITFHLHNFPPLDSALFFL